jgi:hypothetical protein
MNTEAAVDEAFRASREAFEAMCAPGHRPTSAIEAAQLDLLARYAMVAHRQGDLVDALHLIGAVGSVVSADEYPDRVGAAMTALALVTIVSASWRLAVAPIVTTAMAVVPSDLPPSVGDSQLARELLLGVPDLVLSVTAESKPDTSTDDLEQRRRQVFIALGMVTTGLVIFGRLMDGDTPFVELYLQAVESAWT